MKKALCILVTALLLLSLAACGASGVKPSDTNGGEATAVTSDTETPPEPEAPDVIDDTSVNAMSFKAPEGFVSVKRTFDKTTDGTITAKNVEYTFADGSILEFAYSLAQGEQLSDHIPADTETKDYGGKTFYVIPKSGDIIAAVQEGEEIYGVSYEAAEEAVRETFDGYMAGISFEEDAELTEIEPDIGNVTYSFDDSWNPVSVFTSEVERSDETTERCVYIWRFGKDAKNLDFRFQISRYVNSTIAEQIKESDNTEEKVINGITYTVVLPSDAADKPFKYFTQQGDDVYLISNNGVSDGWFTDRTEESEAAFEIFINGVSFGEGR